MEFLIEDFLRWPFDPPTTVAYLTLLAVLVQSRIMRGQLKASEDAALAAKDAAEAAKEQAKVAKDALDASLATAREDRRAWVSVKSAHLRDFPGVGRFWTVDVSIINSGQTPALNLVCHAEVLIKRVSDPMERITGSEEIGDGTVLGPGVGVLLPVYSRAKLEKHWAEGMLPESGVALFVRGVIRYRDISGAAHETLFSLFEMGNSLVKGVPLMGANTGNTAT